MSQYVFKRTGYKRQKYTSHACLECHRRKVKCSGGRICSNCQTRGIECTYEENNQRGRKPMKRHERRASSSHTPPSTNSFSPEKAQGIDSLRDQISQLQQKVDEIYQIHPPFGDDPFGLGPSSTSSKTPTDIPLNSELLPSGSQCANFMPESYFSNTNIDSAYHSSCMIDLRRCRSTMFQTTDSFVPSTRSAREISDGSKIKALQKLHTRESISAKTITESDNEYYRLAVQLPKPSTLWSRVDDFFQEFPCFFPFLRENEVRKQIAVMLESVKFTEEHCQVLISSKNCKIMAILFNILAYGEAVMELASETGYNSFEGFDSPPGSESYCRGLNVMEFFGQLHDNDIETVVYHALSASFFFAAEKLQMALSSASVSFHIARYIELNNEERWPKDLKDELVCRKSLWWTLYFLDKRISGKIGITYCVREDECSVREFIDTVELNPGGHHELLQSMITFSHLWAKIWDCFFASNSRTEDTREELELTDTKILLAYRRVPFSLRWKTEDISTYLMEAGEQQVRRRLLVWLRFTFLRLSIRHKPLVPDSLDRQRRKSCIAICKEMIEAVKAYTDTFGHNKPSGYMLTSALVDSIYWVEIERQNSHQVIAEAIIADLRLQAANLLHDLALDIGPAARAYGSLGDILSSGFAAIASQEIESLSQKQGKPQNSQSMGISSGDSLESMIPFGLRGATGLTPTLDRIQGYTAPDSETFLGDALDFAPNMDWGTIISPLSFTGCSDLQFDADFLE